MDSSLLPSPGGGIYESSPTGGATQVFLLNRGAARVGWHHTCGCREGALGGGLGGLRCGPRFSGDKCCGFLIQGMW